MTVVHFRGQNHWKSPAGQGGRQDWEELDVGPEEWVGFRQAEKLRGSFLKSPPGFWPVP